MKKEDFESKLKKLKVYRRFKSNFDGDYSILFSGKIDFSFSQMIERAFVWQDTPEGHRFWWDISEK